MTFHEQLAHFVEKKKEEGPSFFEKQLRRFLSFEELNRLSLPPSCYPHFARGLPLLYHRDDPSRFCLQKPFQNLFLLQRRLMDKALWSLYDRAPRFSATIILISWIIPGGMGDYSAALAAAELLKKNVPEWEVHLVVVADEKAVLFPPSKKLLVHKVLYQHGSKLDLPYIRFSKEVVQIFARADVVLQIPTLYPSLSYALSLIPQHAFHFSLDLVREYGFIASDYLSPPPLSKSMGLHFLEMGIFVKDSLHDDKTYTCLRKRYRLGPTRFDTKSYFAYLITEAGFEAFLHALLTAHPEQFHVDLFMPDIGYYLYHLDKWKKALLFYPVSELILHTPNKISTISLSSKGYRLRLIHTGVLTKEEFQTLLYYCEDFVGCRGDQSFSEAFSLRKVYFYDGLLHSKDFLKDLVSLCKYYLPTHSSTVAYLQLFLQNMAYYWKEDPREWVEEEFFTYSHDLSPSQVGKKMGMLLKDPSTKEGIMKLNDYLIERHDLCPHLRGMVARSIILKNNPHLAKREEELVKKVIERKISFSSMMQKLGCLLSCF